jgi:hypothetical protein
MSELGEHFRLVGRCRSRAEAGACERKPAALQGAHGATQMA